MLFREVADALLTVLRGAAWLDASREVTVVRALDGTVRLLVETPNGPAPQPNSVADLTNELNAALGDWLGQEQPVLLRRGATHRALVEAIHVDRKPWHPTVPLPCRLFRLERHAARHGWVGELPHEPPWPIAAADDGTYPPVVTFFSHKGGLGRSTALAATAIHLAERGHRVLAVDLDLEAPGLGILLADPAATEPGLVDLLVGPDTVVAEHVAHVATPSAADLGIGGPPVLVVKAGEVDEGYLEILARLDLHGARDVAAITKRLRTVLRELNRLHAPDIILLDARTGFHDVGGVALGALSHGAVFLGMNNEQSWQGLRAVARMLASAGRDDDDEPYVWLQVVHALAPAGGDDTEEKGFVEAAYDALAEHYYLEGSVPQGVPVVALPWRDGLRGKGNRLTPRVVEILREAPWKRLASAIADRYDHLRMEDQ